jgi:hypothetical protein
VGSTDRDWAHRTPSLNGLSYRFAVCSDDARLGRHTESLLAGLAGPADAAGDAGDAPIQHWYSLTASTTSRASATSPATPASPLTAGTSAPLVDVCIDRQSGVCAQRPGDALRWLVWHVNQAAAHAGRDHLLFHAAAVCDDADAGDGGDGAVGVLIPGASGSGKSTLAAGLVRDGLSYLSDELVAVELTSGRMLPYAKPITVKPGSFDVLRCMRAGDGHAEPGNDDDDLWTGEEWLLPVGAMVGRPVARPCRPSLVVVPRYESGAATALTPLSETEAFVALALNAVNFTQHAGEGVRALGELVARSTCFALVTSDLRQASGLVRQAAATARAEWAAASVPPGAYGVARAS